MRASLPFLIKTAQRWSIAFLYGALCFVIGLQAFGCLSWAALGDVPVGGAEGFPVRVPPQEFAAGFAFALTPLLAGRWMRRRMARTHRFGVWLWCAMSAIGGPAALAMASDAALADDALRVGLSVWTLLWMDTTLLALWSLRTRDAAGARRWMYRSAALICAAAASRWWRSSLWMPMLFDGPEPFAIAWVLWPLSLAACEALLRRPWMRFATANRPMAYSLFGA